ncbi:LysM peptidoglycan-binding domain-containing protein [Streptomyces sp. Tue 6430]|nr:LysM peptidoglycan-binding domain-containing protein [Streptomyces sp. Tue 6430]
MVRAGDTLSTIAARHGTTWQRLYAANRTAIGGNPDLIVPGLRLNF